LQVDWTLRGELEGVGQQVLQDLLQARRVRRERARQRCVDVHVERKILRLRDVAEAAVDGFPQGREADLLGLHRDGPGLDLRQVQDVVDQRQQIGPGGVNVPREVDLTRGQVAPGVLR